MRRLLPLAIVLAIAIASEACARRSPGPTVSLVELVRSYDREVTPYHPLTASDVGLRQYDRVFANDIGADDRDGLRALCGRYRQDLRRLDRSALNSGELLTHDVFEYRLDTCLESLEQPWHLRPLNQAGSWPTRFPILGMGRGSHPFKTVRNSEDFLGRIDGFVVWIDTAIENMRGGMARGITQPRDAMVKLVPQLDAQIVDDPRASAFYEPIKSWTRQQAIEFIGGRRQNAEREAERYMVWPAQALGYHIGNLKTRALRTRAEAALAPRATSARSTTSS